MGIVSIPVPNLYSTRSGLMSDSLKKKKTKQNINNWVLVPISVLNISPWKKQNQSLFQSSSYQLCTEPLVNWNQNCQLIFNSSLYNLKPCKNFIYKHIADLKNVQSIRNKREFKGHQISTNQMSINSPSQ
jgi:hypothetical protein